MAKCAGIPMSISPNEAPPSIPAKFAPPAPRRPTRTNSRSVPSSPLSEKPSSHYLRRSRQPMPQPTRRTRRATKPSTATPSHKSTKKQRKRPPLTPPSRAPHCALLVGTPRQGENAERASNYQTTKIN